MGADNPGWVPPEAGAVRALPVALTLMDQGRARKHDTDLSNRLVDQAFGLLGRDAILTITGRQNAGKLPDCGAPAREQVIGLAGAGGAGIGTVILIGDHDDVCEDQGARRVREPPADPGESRGRNARYGLMEPQDGPAGIVQASGEPGARVRARPAAGYGVLAAGGRRGEEDEQA